MLTPYI